MINTDMKTPIIKVPNPFQVASCERSTWVKGVDCEDEENSKKLDTVECNTSTKPHSSSPPLGGSSPTPEVEMGGVEVIVGPSSQDRIEQQECDDSDSDCLIIAEGEESQTTDTLEIQEDIIPTSQSPITPSITGMNQQEQEQLSSQEESNENVITRKTESCETQRQNNLKVHNLPIHELKRKLAFCSVCHTQYQNHKQANLCLSKHGKRQCWLCLDVMANTKDSYFQHCLRHHSIGSSGQNDIVGCPYCHKFFDFRQGFNQHIVKVHFSEDVTYVTSNNACLETLVDIFTGQPRSTKQRLLSSDEGVTSNIDTRLHPDEGGCGREPGLRLPSLIYPTSSPELYLVDSSTLPIQLENNTFTPPSIISSTPTTPISCQDNVSLKTKFNYKIPPVQAEFNNKEVSNNSEGGDQEQSFGGPTRESVIRETPQPQPNQIHPMIQMQHPQEFAFFHHHHQNNPRFQPPHHAPHNICTKSKLGKSYSFYGTHQNQNSKQKYFHPFPSQYAPNVPNSVNASTCQQFVLSQNLNLPPHPHERRVSFSSDNRTSRSNFRYDELQMTGQMSPLVGSKSHQSLHPYRNQTQQQHRPRNQNPIQTPHRGTNIHLHPRDQLSPQPSSPCLLEMEKMIHSTPVQVQYFNSVNSMLRTVAEFNPGGIDPFSPTPTPSTTPTTIHSSPISFPFLGNQSDQSVLNSNSSNNTFNWDLSSSPPNRLFSDKRKASFSNGGRLQSDSETFKVPSNGGIKRRILTNFLRDEHQEINTKGKHQTHFSRVVPSPTTQHNKEYDTLADQAQVEIRKGLNPVNCRGGNDHNISQRPGLREDKRFWEQVLKESNGMYGNRMVNDETVQIYESSPSGGRQNFESNCGLGEETSYGAPSLSPVSNKATLAAYCLAQSQQQSQIRYENEDQFMNSQTVDHGRHEHRHNNDSTHQQSYQNPGYPRIMARVDASGRPIGVFTANGQPCTVSGYEIAQRQRSFFTAAEVAQNTVSEQTRSHLKYQHRIIQQESSPQGSRSSSLEHQCDNSSFRESHRFPLHRKRKSSIPVRLLPSVSDSDNIIVQNPFQDQESSSKGSPLSQDNFEKISPPIALIQNQHADTESIRASQLSKNEQQPKSQLNQRSQTSFVSKVDRFINYLPKFTSGGQITDFSGRNLWVTGEGGKVIKNFSNISVAANIGIWNSSVGIGDGVVTKSTSAVATDLQIQHHSANSNSEYYENAGNGNGGIGPSGLMNSGQGSNDNLCGGGWPPFAVCQRYFETTQNIMSRLKDLDNQRKGHLL